MTSVSTVVVRRSSLGTDDSRSEAVRRHRQRRSETISRVGPATGEASSDSSVHVSMMNKTYAWDKYLLYHPVA